METIATHDPIWEFISTKVLFEGFCTFGDLSERVYKQHPLKSKVFPSNKSFRIYLKQHKCIINQTDHILWFEDSDAVSRLLKKLKYPDANSQYSQIATNILKISNFQKIVKVCLHLVKIILKIGSINTSPIDGIPYSDIKLFAFSNDTDFENFLKEAPYQLRDIALQITNAEDLLSVSKYSIKFKKENLDVELFIAFDFFPNGISNPLIRQEGFLKMRNLHPKYNNITDASTAEMKREFLKNRSKEVKNVCKLLKLWRNFCVLKGPFYPSNYLLNLVAVKYYDENKSIHENLYYILAMLRNWKTLSITWDIYYEQSLIPTEILNERRPLILDPANPFNNVAQQVRRWDYLALMIEDNFPALFFPEIVEANSKIAQDIRELGTFFILEGNSVGERKDHEEIGAIWMQAIRDDNIQLISQLLKNGIEVNQQLTCGSIDGIFFDKATPLHMACLFKKKGFKSCGANIDFQCNDVVIYKKDEKGTRTIDSSPNCTPLELIGEHDFVEIMKQMPQRKQSSNSNWNIWTFAAIATSSFLITRLFRYLLKK